MRNEILNVGDFVRLVSVRDSKLPLSVIMSQWPQLWSRQQAAVLRQGCTAGQGGSDNSLNGEHNLVVS